MSEIRQPSLYCLNEARQKQLMKDFPFNEGQGWVLVGDKKYCFPAEYGKDIDKYYNFEVKLNDIWIVSYPRSGSTWTQELVWLICNNLDYQTANRVLLNNRVGFLERSLLSATTSSTNAKSYEQVQNMRRPRFIRTHFPLELIPNVLKSDAKIVYVARNPKDAAVSYYYLLKERRRSYQGNFEQFWNYFECNELLCTPYWEHLKEAWHLRNNSNLLFIFYEDMKQDLISQAKRVAEFFNKSYNDNQYQELANHLQFENFKHNKMVNGTHIEAAPAGNGSYIRKGESQNWQELFTSDLNNRANRWIRENLKNTDIRFPYIDIYA